MRDGGTTLQTFCASVCDETADPAGASGAISSAMRGGGEIGRDRPTITILSEDCE